MVYFQTDILVNTVQCSAFFTIKSIEDQLAIAYYAINLVKGASKSHKQV